MKQHIFVCHLLVLHFSYYFSNKMQVPPAELEHILHTNPEIADAAVVPYVFSALIFCVRSVAALKLFLMIVYNC